MPKSRVFLDWRGAFGVSLLALVHACQSTPLPEPRVDAGADSVFSTSGATADADAGQAAGTYQRPI